MDNTLCRSVVLAAALVAGGMVSLASAQEKTAEKMAESPATQPAGKRSAETIVSDYKAVESPKLDMAKIQAKDEAYKAEYMAAAKKTTDQRSALAKELFESFPENPELPTMMEARWSNPANSAEADAVVAAGKPAQLLPVAYGAQVTSAFRATSRDKEKLPELRTAIAAFEKRFPTDKRSSTYNEMLMRFLSEDDKKAVEQHVLAAYPDSALSQRIKAQLKQQEAVGKPFELKFEDAITGHAVNMDSLRGKVVVIDFWATWCGPCVAEMPKMKDLYAEFKDKGVEFIGVSLDQPEETGKGLTKLKEFVAKNEIGWPQYYQGNFWNSAFSKGWGINSIPCVFIVDKEGKLYSTQARGKLETLIPQLLVKGTGTEASPASGVGSAGVKDDAAK